MDRRVHLRTRAMQAIRRSTLHPDIDGIDGRYIATE